MLSEFFFGHTIGRLYQGLLRHLDRRRFEVVLIHAPSHARDAFSARLEALADQTMVLPARLQGQQRAVASARLDVLFYPDIGMSSATYFLAYARLAPLQMVGWGHPVTTGLKSMDYFVSAKCIEPQGAPDHYTETLAQLDRLPCFYPSIPAQTQTPSRAALGLPEKGALYGCPQSLFKIHPDFDVILAAIAEGDPDGHILFLEGASPSWSHLLKSRWQKAFPALHDRALFLPRLPWEQFFSMMAHMDVLLDPIHFGSGNTMYEAMSLGVPVVTWAGEFMRGRIVAGAYRQMGLADAPVVRDLGQYAPTALALAHSPRRREVLRSACIDAARRELFDDMSSVREIEDFIERALAHTQGGGPQRPNA
jgi:predicted O-linked N-acetylglucosamine transferase (SPINDLY family)